MTINESIALRKILQSSYNRKEENDIETDIIFHQLLGDCDFRICSDVIINLVKTSKYMPTINEIINAYEDRLYSRDLIIAHDQEEILQRMIADGYFDRYDNFTAYEQSIKKARKMLFTNIIPELFLKDFKNYQNKKITYSNGN